MYVEYASGFQNTVCGHINYGLTVLWVQAEEYRISDIEMRAFILIAQVSRHLSILSGYGTVLRHLLLLVTVSLK